MKYCVTCLLFFSWIFAYGQDKQAYLNKNKWDLEKQFVFEPGNAKLIGFGAYHGGAKTEDAEITLVTALCKKGLRYYVAETDMAIAHFFNEYLKSGDEALLKELVTEYGTRVPQERTIEVYEKWKKLKKINDELPENSKLTVLGPDPVVTYKYTYKLLLALIKDTSQWDYAKQLENTVAADLTDYSPYYESFSKKQLAGFIADFEANEIKYSHRITDRSKFDDVTRLIKTSFGKYHREEEIYKNYVKLYLKHNLKNALVYVRYGFFHVMKAKEGKAVSFFTRLLDNGLNNNENLISIIGYFNESEVIWEDVYSNGEYSHSTTSVEGTGDSDLEYFRGIEELKKQKLSGLTLYKLDGSNSPYSRAGCIDLIEIITPERSNINYSGQTTTSFINYALLISNSEPSRSLYGL